MASFEARVTEISTGKTQIMRVSGSTLTSIISNVLSKLKGRGLTYRIMNSALPYEVLIYDKFAEAGREKYKILIEKANRTQDKSPLSFMDSVVRAFRDRVEILGTKNPLNESYYQGKITYELIGKGKRIIKFVTTANNESDFKRQAEAHLQHKHYQGEYKLLGITEIKKANITPKRREIIEK